MDDEPDNTTVLKMGLTANGFDVDAYNLPAEALAEYRPGHYDFHVLDIRMQGMNGFELARAIWQKDPSAQVCFLTAFEIYENEANKVFKDLNTRCFLKKPITPSALADHLRLHLAKKP